MVGGADALAYYRQSWDCVSEQLVAELDQLKREVGVVRWC